MIFRSALEADADHPLKDTSMKVQYGLQTLSSRNGVSKLLLPLNMKFVDHNKVSDKQFLREYSFESDLLSDTYIEVKYDHPSS